MQIQTYLRFLLTNPYLFDIIVENKLIRSLIGMKKTPIFLATTFALSTFLLGQNVNADEVSTTSEPKVTEVGASTTESTVSTTSETSTASTSTTTVESIEPNTSTTEVSETPTTETNKVSEGVSAEPTKVTKEGSEITVTNPKVTVDQSDGAGKYNAFKVKYENITIPDEIPVNEGDKVVLTLPKEVKFQTSFEFDVKNPTQDIVGKAYADSESGKLTTVFNSYFQSHPLNKQMSLTFDAQWTDVVESGKPVTANFNGTLVTTNIAKEQEIGKDELVAKWGGQDKDDPTVINWTIRVNYARRVLNTVKLLDTFSDNQKLVDDFLEVGYVDSVDPWVYAGDAKNLVKSMVKNPNGFELTLARLERMVYVNYKTKLTSPIKESVNPTNEVKLTAGDVTAKSTIEVSLVGGKGNAVGENKPEPTWELPNDAPIYEKPEINVEDVPMAPPAPIFELPEWKGGTVPFDAPFVEKPEWNGGTTPWDAPILDKPEYKLTKEDVPPTDSRTKNNKPKVEEVPKGDKPKGEEVPKNEIPKVEQPKGEETPKQVEIKSVVYGAEPTLPNTGESSTTLLTFVGVVVLGTSMYLMRKAKEEN